MNNIIKMSKQMPLKIRRLSERIFNPWHLFRNVVYERGVLCLIPNNLCVSS